MCVYNVVNSSQHRFRFEAIEMERFFFDRDLNIARIYIKKKSSLWHASPFVMQCHIFSRAYLMRFTQTKGSNELYARLGDIEFTRHASFQLKIIGWCV